MEPDDQVEIIPQRRDNKKVDSIPIAFMALFIYLASQETHLMLVSNPYIIFHAVADV